MDGWAQLTEKADGIKYAHDEITCEKPVICLGLLALYVCCSETSSLIDLETLKLEVIKHSAVTAISSLEMHSHSISAE